MARIRSIKPEFWSDAKVDRLRDSTALFFIALWNFADDDGIFSWDSRGLSLQVPRFRSQAIQAMLSSLQKARLVQCSRDAQLGLIVGWKHQRIDKPRPSKYKVNEIEWLDYVETGIKQDHDKNEPRKDRIGSDTIGSDRIGREQTNESAVADVVASPQKPDEVLEVFLAYCESWMRNPKTYQLTPERRKWIRDAIAIHGKQGAMMGVHNFRCDSFKDRAKFNDLKYLFGKRDRIDTYCQPRLLQNTPAFQRTMTNNQETKDTFEIAKQMAEAKYGKN